MMPILVKWDDVRSERKAEAYHGLLWPAQESMGYQCFKKDKGELVSDKEDK